MYQLTADTDQERKESAKLQYAEHFRVSDKPNRTKIPNHVPQTPRRHTVKEHSWESFRAGSLEDGDNAVNGYDEGKDQRDLTETICKRYHLVK